MCNSDIRIFVCWMLCYLGTTFGKLQCEIMNMRNLWVLQMSNFDANGCLIVLHQFFVFVNY
jgi:hypothetical protein